jgi:hypothetical protein
MTFDQLEEIAFGWLNLTPEELYDFTPRQYYNKLSGFEKLETKRERDQWEKFRLLATTLISPHTKKGRTVRPEQLWPFDWDIKKPAEKMSKEKIEYLEARANLIRKNV